jgi:protein-arginine kinase activator protein McsA
MESKDNRYYAKICAECRTNAIKLFLTPVQDDGDHKKLYRMLCENCAAKHSK